jgi:type IV secretion system protein VirB10
MRTRLIALLSMATLVSAQTPHAILQTVTNAATAGQATAPVSAHTLTVPAGTAIPLTLINPIKKKSTTPGDAVRATVAFPIMAGMQVAIPAGSYVEGVVQQLTARASDTHQPQVGIHFTRLVFANGYSVSLDASSAQAEDIAPNLGTPATELATLTPPAIGMGRGSMGMMGQTSPTLPTVSMPGPNPAVVTGAMLGGAAALGILIFALAHHSQSKVDYVLFDAGWQFQMILQSPLVVDASQVAAAAAVPSVN